MQVERRVAAGSGWLRVHPDAAGWLERHGLVSPQAILGLQGEIVGGHVDRHVAEVAVGGRIVYLKREHRVPLVERIRNFRDGYGFCSKSEREWKSLVELHDRGLPVPEWMAVGADPKGRSFLLLDECADFEPLDAFRHLDAVAKRGLASALGRTVGAFHAAGYATPDLHAKHVFANRDTGELRLLDWQRSGRGGRDFVRPLVQLLRSCEATSGAIHAFWREYAAENPAADLRLLRRVLALSRGKRPSHTGNRASHRLVWLDGEAIVALPEIAGVLKPDIYGPILYPEIAERDSTLRLGAFEARLVCETRTAWLPRALHKHGRPRLGCLARARLLFHLQRHGLPAPRVLAFGHRWESPFTARGFLLTEPGDLPGERQGPMKLLERLHAAGCVIEGRSERTFGFNGERGTWHIQNADDLRLMKRVEPRRAARDRDALAAARREAA